MALGSLKAALGFSTLFVASALFGGCGSTEDSLFSEENREEGEREDGGESDPYGLGDKGPSGDIGEVGNVDPSSACATASKGAVLEPISLVFMIDRSGSMSTEVVDGKSIDVSPLRWNPVKDGLLAFFGDPRSNNISASLAFFPILSNGYMLSCTADDYEDPVIPMTKLPSTSAFTPAFATGPGGTTPTHVALKGALDLARTVKASGENVAVVLATDGEPAGCSSTRDKVNGEAASGLAAGIKTYVIGVGPSTGNLDSFAQNGGTTKAIMIPTNNASQVSADLRSAIGQIASELLGCAYGLPAPPDGKSLDINAVNVNYTPPGGTMKTLGYSADCSDPNGWQYDNPSAPKEIRLCANSCSTAMAEIGATLDIVFGCATKVAGPN